MNMKQRKNANLNLNLNLKLKSYFTKVRLNQFEKKCVINKESKRICLFIPIAEEKVLFFVWSICLPIKTSLEIFVKTVFDSTERKILSQKAFVWLGL